MPDESIEPLQSFEQRVKGKQVIVIANGIEYRGKLAGMTDEDVYVITVLGWVILPMDRVSSVHDVNEVKPRRPVDIDLSYFVDS